MKVEIVRARKEDAPVVVRLMLNALGDYANFLMISENTSTILNRLQKCFISEENNQFHYSNCLVALVDGVIVGACSSYAGDKIELFNENLAKIIPEFSAKKEEINEILELLEYMREAENDEYYMDTLSVDKEYRKLGISQSLIQGVCEKSLSEGFVKLSIVVQEGKEYLLDYYQKQDFEIAGIKNLGDINYYRLVKKLK